ncbi:MAG: hypothetical protein ACKO96_26625, partial [Flammeovirgaceae bacterium]
VCQYIRKQYPDVIFTSEPSGLRLPIGQAVKLKKLRSGAKLPDLWILEKRGNYGGLFLELKTQPIYNSKGTFVSLHVKEQAQTIKRLCDKGYQANFAVCFDDAKKK